MNKPNRPISAILGALLGALAMAGAEHIQQPEITDAMRAEICADAKAAP